MSLSLRSFAFAAVALPLALTAVPSVSQASEKGNPEASRIVAIGGTVTEVLYALGAGDRVIARDSTSSYPVEVLAKPDVGYMRALSSEGILSQKPDLILSEDGAGPADVIGIFKASEVPMVIIDTPPRADAISRKIEDIGAAVGLSEKAKALADDVEAGLAALKSDVAAVSTKKRVLFVLSTAGGRIMAAGKDTEAGAIIELAGGVNAAADVTGYKPLSDEAVISAAPDVVLTMQRGDHAATADEIFALPAFQSTPAAASRALISMDGLYLIGFGPRTPAAGRELASQLYPEVVKP